MKSPLGRISIIKNMSFEEVSFYQHIFQEYEPKSADMTLLDVFGSQQLTPSQKTGKKLKNLFMDKLDDI